MNLQAFCILESVFFGLGLVFAIASIVTVMWSKITPSNTDESPNPKQMQNSTDKTFPLRLATLRQKQFVVAG
jgi:hypothetical protein